MLEVGSEALILEHYKTELFSALLTKMPVGTKQDQYTKRIKLAVSLTFQSNYPGNQTILITTKLGALFVTGMTNVGTDYVVLFCNSILSSYND